MSVKSNGVWRLSFALLAILAVWLIVLPAVSQMDPVRHRIDANREAGINPTAVFYTDHPSMADIERRMDAKVNAPSAWFWKRNLP